MNLGLFGLLIGAFSVSCSVPQALRMLRTRNTCGVSLGSTLMAAACSCAWVLYGFLAADTAQEVTNLAAAVTAFAVLAVLVAHLPRPAAVRRAVRGLAASAAAVGGCYLAGGVAAVSVLAVCGSVARSLPQVREALSGAPLAGLSPAACAMTVASCVLWTVYGLAAGDVAVTVSSAAGAALNAVVLARRCPPARRPAASAGTVRVEHASALGPVAAAAPAA